MVYVRAYNMPKNGKVLFINIHLNIAYSYKKKKFAFDRKVIGGLNYISKKYYATVRVETAIKMDVVLMNHLDIKDFLMR